MIIPLMVPLGIEYEGSFKSPDILAPATIPVTELKKTANTNCMINCLVKELSLCGIYVYSGLKFWSRCSGLKNMSKTHH